MSPILPPRDGYLFLDRAKFAASFAADIDLEFAGFVAAVIELAAKGVGH